MYFPVTGGGIKAGCIGNRRSGISARNNVILNHEADVGIFRKLP
jgi:hypothetical protein